MNLPTLYKRDNMGRIRTWRVEVGNDEQGRPSYRTVSGLVDGTQTESEWRFTEGKNIGRSNETTPLEQAYAEAQSMIQSRKDRGYFERVTDVDKKTKFEPMLAETYGKRPISFEDLWTQPKLDGIRCIARADGLWTRAGKEIVSCPHIMEALNSSFVVFPDLVLDGELYNHNLKDDFNKITSLVRKTKPTAEDIAECRDMVQFHIYDALTESTGFPDRLQEAVLVLDTNFSSIQFVNTYNVANQNELDGYYGKFLEDGYEGQMIRYNAPYENKRSKNLLKRKEFITEEFKVVAVEEGKGNWSGHVKRFVLALPEDSKDETCGAGVRGTQDVLKGLWLDGKTPDWATVRFFGWTPDGSLRFPVVVDWGFGARED